MPKQIIMIVPRVNHVMSFPDEYHTTCDVDCSSREDQEATIGKAMVDAVELAQNHPHYADFPDVHFVVMYATITGEDN